MFRAWRAAENSGAQPLQNAKGEPVLALLSLLRGMMKVETTLPDVSHLLVAMDNSTSRQRRSEIFPNYKAQRPQAPAELVLQMGRVEEACEAFGWQYASMEGYEADDVISSYAEHVLNASETATVHIISPDKDLLQLVQPRVRVHRWLRPVEGMSRKVNKLEEETDEQSVLAEWKVRPEQLGDLLALVGDACDNLAGVPGIGMVRAARLLQEHGTLERLLKAASEERLGGTLTRSLARNLREHEEQARRVREAVALLTIPQLPALRPLGEAASRRPEMLAFCEREGAAALATSVRTRFGDAQPPVTVVKVDSRAAAEQAMQRLRGQPGRFAVAVGPDLKCLSICGPAGVDLGGGRCLWLDLRGGPDWTAEQALSCFADFFKDPAFEKVYHCFGDARRVIFPDLPAFGEVDERHRGLHSDTMHMARLLNPAFLDLSLEALTLEVLERELLRPPTLASAAERHEAWPEGAARRALALLELQEELEQRLRLVPWRCLAGGPDAEPVSLGASLLDFYHQYWLPFGQLLSDIEVTGCFVNRPRLAELTRETEGRCQALENQFRAWAVDRLVETYGPDVAKGANLELLNLHSSRQLLQLFFGTEEVSFEERAVAPAAEAPAPPPVRPAAELQGLSVAGLKELCREHGLKVSGKKAELINRLAAPTAADLRAAAAPRLRLRLRGLGLEPLTDHKTKKLRAQALTQKSLLDLRDLRRDELRDDGVEAIGKFLDWRELDKTLQYLRSLEVHSRQTSRIYSSFNLNTETGRLSSRNPNLQQMPSGFDVRDVFAAPPGRMLVVADYSQLELRVVAHLAACRPMIDLLVAGGDIHSSTAYRMFDEVREAVDAGRVLLDSTAGGRPPEGLQLVKDAFPELRKRAKVLNFSLLYGKTPFGLAKDWGVEKQEASAMTERWFAAFPEIGAWIRQVKEEALRGSFARTVLGRIRPIRGTAASGSARDAALRQAVNSPVQGSAADIVAAAMLRLEASERLRQLGFRQILQIHDEIVLEGPEELAHEAREEMLRIMEEPLPFELLVPLRVDARVVRAWGDSK